ncbi:hypothetical protein D3C80_898370 [compost metagenome]
MLHIGQLGDLGGAGGAQDFGVAAIGAGGGAGGVQQDGVEDARILPVLGRNGDDLDRQAGAVEILTQALQAGRRTIQGRDLGARRGQLQGLAAGGGAHVQHGLAGLGAQQAGGDGGGGVLDPPVAGLEPGPAGDIAALAGADRAAGQDLALDVLGQGGQIDRRLGAEIGGGLLAGGQGQAQESGLAVGGPPAGGQPVGQVGFRRRQARTVAIHAAQDGVDQVLVGAGLGVALSQFHRGRDGGEGGGAQDQGLGQGDAQDGAHRGRRGLLQAAIQDLVDLAQAAQGRHGHGAGEGAVGTVQVLGRGLAERLVQTRALLQGGVQQDAGDQAGLDADVGVGVVGHDLGLGLATRTARLFSHATTARGRAFALGRTTTHTETCVPSSTTRPGGIWKKSVGLAALRIRKMNSLSCHRGMP